MNLRIVVLVIVSIFLLTVAVLVPGVAEAHQPYCETTDLTMDSPWQAPDATISYAYYGNLYPAADVDYFTFEASAGQSVLLSLSIPDIEGQEDFAPVMAVFGPGLEMDESVESLPERVVVPEGEGGMMIDVGEEPEYWYEPFGGRYYWNWENTYFDAPEDATYTVVLWHPEQELGRYSFVIGEEEIRGGDRECMAAFDTYWTPLVAGESPYQDAAEDKAMDMESHVHADGETHDHSTPLEVTVEAAPYVDLQVFPLDDGSYNVRVQTLNFTFMPQHVDMDPMEGQGHAHLYVDDVKIARIYGEWYHLESLPEDAEMVSVALYANNHQPLAVDGEQITDRVMVADLYDETVAAVEMPE